MKKKLLFALLFILLTVGAYSYLDNPFETDRVLTSSFVKDEGDIEVHFCPEDDCEKALLEAIDSAQISLHCALFDIGLQSLQEKLLEKSSMIDVKIVTDNDYFHKLNHAFVRKDSWGLMHNKFCIIDSNKMFTGSMNPTDNGVRKNNNNFLVITSKVLSSNYESEFQEMWEGNFKGGGKVLNPLIKLDNIELGDIEIKNYFCPEDNCAYHVKEELKKAEKSIHFMTFSFTNEGIANILLLKNMEGVEIYGIMEARQVTKYSQFERLLHNGINVVKDSNPNNMHHKVFIIDGRIVITGSFNPTNNGDKGNDENVLIIESEKIANMFEEEFRKIW